MERCKGRKRIAEGEMRVSKILGGKRERVTERRWKEGGGGREMDE